MASSPSPTCAINRSDALASELVAASEAAELRVDASEGRTPPVLALPLVPAPCAFCLPQYNTVRSAEHHIWRRRLNILPIFLKPWPAQQCPAQQCVREFTRLVCTRLVVVSSHRKHNHTVHSNAPRTVTRSPATSASLVAAGMIPAPSTLVIVKTNLLVAPTTSCTRWSFLGVSVNIENNDWIASDT